MVGEDKANLPDSLKDYNEYEMTVMLMRYENSLKTGGMVWSNEQLEFLRDMAEEIGKRAAQSLAVTEGTFDFRGAVDSTVEKWVKEKGATTDPNYRPGPKVDAKAELEKRLEE